MKTSFATTWVGLGLGLAVLSGPDAIAQKKSVHAKKPVKKTVAVAKPVIPPDVVMRLREQALDIGLAVLEQDSAAAVVKADVLANYVSYRTKLAPRRRVLADNGRVGIDVFNKNDNIHIRQFDSRKPKQVTEIIYEPDANQGAMIANFTVNRVDSSGATVDKASTLYTRRSLEEGYQKTGYTQMICATQSNCVVGNSLYRADSVYTSTIGLNRMEDSLYVTRQLNNVHGLFKTTYNGGSVVQQHDTTREKSRELLEMVRDALAPKDIEKMTPFVPARYKAVLQK